MDMNLLNEEPNFVKALKNTGCMRFCQKLQGFHTQISNEVATNFTGTTSKVGILNFSVSPKTIAQGIEIPRQGEECFKSTKFKLQNCDEFMKAEYVGNDIAVGIPRKYLKEDYFKLLVIIHKYFTCKGRFHMVYQYHFKLLLHFTGKQAIDLPFYLFRSLNKMVDNVQARPKNSDTSVFHHGIIKPLLLEELGKINRY